MNYGYITVSAGIPSMRVADTDYNVKQIESMTAQAEGKGAEIIVFPELSVTGYTCQDLFYQQTLLDQAELAILHLLNFSRKLDIIIIVGCPVPVGGLLLNCAIVLQHGNILGIVPKTYLPNYGEFYEKRWFSSSRDISETTIRFAGNQITVSPSPRLFKTCDGVCFGIEICEDLWSPTPCSNTLALAGADVIFNLSDRKSVV